MSLFINTISENIAGTVVLSLPSCTDGGRTLIEGFLSEEPSITLKNEWDSVIPDISSINDFTQIAGLGASSWLSTSKAAWKGTSPIKVSLNFYLLTYKKCQVTKSSQKSYEQPVSVQAAKLGQLLAVGAGEQMTGAGVLNALNEAISVSVHGGYKPAYFQRNTEFLGQSDNANSSEKLRANTAFTTDDSAGTIQIAINGKDGQTTAIFTDMLVEDATFTPSTVRTGYWEGSQFITSSEPLYIRVSATFRLSHAATVADVARMFTGRSSL